MADVNTQSCDVCDKLRGKTNHWFKATHQPGRFYLVDWESDLPYTLKSGVIHLCGEACAIKAFSAAIGTKH